MKFNYDKWNNYTIGNIPWINSRREHLSRKLFIEYIISKKIKNILEIGGGEVIEGQIIRELNPKINYTLLDVSNTFLEYAKEKGFRTIQAEMFDTKLKNKEFDIVYLSSVLEHSPNINETIKELKRISKTFYFTMFKWKFKSGGLTSHFVEKRNYFSTEFNIYSLMELIRKYGFIDEMFISTLTNKKIDFKKYVQNLKDIDFHRNGNYLTIKGKF